MQKKYDIIQMILSGLLLSLLILSGIFVLINNNIKIWDYICLWIVAFVSVANNLIIHISDYRADEGED